MGNDLYWKETPREPEEKLTGLNLSTWNFLKTLFGQEDRTFLDGMELETNDLIQLKTVLATAIASQNKELIEDVQGIIKGIEKFKSITLVVRG